ncbi:hypothetical protein RR46_03918 [Papilio xuthus]|uniref:Uncharacterized protein n=1 Tax=Papilio xuthus TaxID=66420 RepID=A0A194Q2I9_PAPXU|nr:hypothetical protein RR46_03918 [Papilio xuthus]
MSFKIKALLPLVLICCGGVRNEPGGGGGGGGGGDGGADDVAAQDSALLTHFLKTIDAASDEDDLINVTSTILNNLCACIRDSLHAKQLNVVNNNVVVSVPEAPGEEDLDQYKGIYERTCHDLPLQQSDVTLPRLIGYIAKCSRFDFVRKYEEYFMDNQLKSKFKKIMYDILIKSKDRHKYEIKKYNLYEKPQTFDRNAMRAKTESSAVRLSEVDAALEDKGNIYVDFIDPAYDPKHTKISSAKNVSYCNLKSVLTVLLESEKNNLIKTFKLIRKGGTIKVYTSLSTNYAYEQYSDICCYINNTNSYCKTSLNDLNPEENKLNKGEHTEQVNKLKETVSKIKTLIQIYNKKLIRRQGKSETMRTEKVQITNNKNHYYSNLVVDHKNQSTNYSNQHFTYHYKKFMSSKLNKIPKIEKSIAINNSFYETSKTTIDSQLNSERRREDFMNVTNNEISNAAEAEKIYLKVCNYDMWSNTTIKDFSPYNYILSNNTILNNTTCPPVPLQAPTEPKSSDNSWTLTPIQAYTSNYVEYTGKRTENEVKFQRNETDLTESLAYNRNNEETTNIITYSRKTNTSRSEIFRTTKKLDKTFTKIYASEITDRTFLKSIQHTSPLNDLNEVNYVSLMMNSLTATKTTKRWTTPNVTYITLEESNRFSSSENSRVTASYPSSVSTPKPIKQIHSLKKNSIRTRVILPTPYNNVTKSEWVESSTEPTTSIKNGLRNRTLTFSKKSQLPKSLIKEIYQKKSPKPNASQNKVIQSQESKITWLNDALVTVGSMKNMNKRNTSYIEGITTSLMNNIKTNNRFHSQTSTELPTSPISFKKVHQQSHTATVYFLQTANPIIQTYTTPTLNVHKDINTSISSPIPTVLYSETISSTSSFFKNYTKSKTNATHGNINGILTSQSNQTRILHSNREKYNNSLSVQNVTETAATPQTPTLFPSEPVASTSSYFTQYKKSYTKSIFRHLANDSKSRKNQTKPLTPYSEKFTHSKTTEQTKTSTLYTLRTNYDPSNITLHNDKVTASLRVEYFTESAVSPQIPKFLHSVPNTSTSSSFKNAIRSDSKPLYKESDKKSNNNQAKTLTATSERYSKIYKTAERKKTKSVMYSPTPRSIDVQNQIHNKLPTTTQKGKSDAKSYNNYLTKITHQEYVSSSSWNSQVYYQNKMNNITSNETFTKDSFYEYTPFNVEETKSNSSYISRITTSMFKDKYFNINGNKDDLIHTDRVNSESKSNWPLFEQQTNTASLQKVDKIKNKFTTEAMVNKTKGIERDITPKHVNTKMSFENYNEIKQVETRNTPAVSDDYTPPYNLIKVPSTPQQRLKSKEIPIRISSVDRQSDELHVGGDSTFLKSTNRMKSNKKTTTLKLQSKNTIDISALVQTPTVSKLKLARVIDIVDHTRRHIDLSSRQQLQHGTTYAATKTNNMDTYGVGEIPINKSKTKNGSTANFPTYFKATKRANRIYDNFFKITQSTNSIADLKMIYQNESYDKKGIERRTSNNVNTEKISKVLYPRQITKSTFAISNKNKTGANNKKIIFYSSSKTSARQNQIQEIAAKAKNEKDIKHIHTTASKIQTKLFRYKEENNTPSGVFNNIPYPYPMSLESDNSLLSELNEVVLTTQPIQNNTTLSVEPHLTGERVLDSTSYTSPRGRVLITLIPTSSNKGSSMQNKDETTTKDIQIPSHEQSSNNLRNHVQYSNLTHSTQIKKSDTATTNTLVNYKQTVSKKEKNAGKSVTSKKFSVAPTTQIKTMKSIKSSISTTKYSTDFKDTGNIVKVMLQNASTSGQTLAIDTYKHVKYSNDSLDLGPSKTENVVLNSTEIKTFSYASHEKKTTKISEPFIQNPITVDSPKKIMISEYNGMANELTNQPNVFKSSILTDKIKDMENVIMQTIAHHSNEVLLDNLTSYSKHNKSVDTNGTKILVINVSGLNKTSFASPDLTKTILSNVSNIQLQHSLHKTTNSLIDLTTKSAYFQELKEKFKNTKLPTQNTSIQSTYFNDKIKENYNSNDSISYINLNANKTISELYGQIQRMQTNETKFTAINVSDGKLTSWMDNVSRIDKIEKVYKAHDDVFKTLVYFKSQVNSTATVQTYPSKGNQQNAVHESYEGTLKDFTASHPPNVSGQQILNSIEINNNSIAGKNTDNVNNTLSTKNNLTNTENPPFSKLTQYLSDQLKTLRTNEKFVKDIHDTTPYQNEEFYEVANELNGTEEPEAATSRTTSLNNNTHFTDNFRSNALNTTPNMKMSPNNINNHNDNLTHFSNRSAHNIDSVFRVSSPLLQNTRSLDSYDNNTYRQYTESLSLILSSVAPPPLGDSSETDSETTTAKNYNESLQNIAQTLSNMLKNSTNNNSIEDGIIFTNNGKNDLNKTNTMCKGPLIIASNVILLTNPESCGNPSKIKGTGNMRFPLIILTNSSNPTMNMNLKKTNKSIINMDPMTVYNILIENADKIVKEPNQYLRINDLSETPLEAINSGLGHDINTSSTNTDTRIDNYLEVDNKTMQAIAQSINKTKKRNDSEMPQSAETIATSASHSHDANSNITKTNEVTSTDNDLSLAPDTDDSTKLFTNPITEINYSSFTRQYGVLHNLKTATTTFGNTYGTVPYNAYYLRGENQQNENKVYSENEMREYSNDLKQNKQSEGSGNTKQNIINNMEMIPDDLQLNPHINLSIQKNNLTKLSNPFKMVANKDEANPHSSAALNNHPNIFHPYNKKPNQVMETKEKTNVNSNNNRGATTRTIMKHVTDTTKGNKIIKYNSYQPASHVSDVSLDSNMQLLFNINSNNRKALSNTEISLFKKFNHQTTDFKNIFKLGRKDDNDDQFILKFNRRYKTITEKLKTASTAGVERQNESRTSAQQVANHLINFTRKQRTFFTINTKDFFSQRRFYSKDVFKDLSKARRVPFVLQYPATPRATHVVLRPVFRNYGVVNVRQEQKVAAPPNARRDATQYEKQLKDDEKSKLTLWQDKIVSFQNLLLDELKSNVLEKPEAAAPATERGLFDGLYNYDDLHAPAKIKKYYLKYLSGANNNKIAKNREVYRKTLDPKNFKNTSTTTESSSKRSRRTIFFLSPTVPYNRYF